MSAVSLPIKPGPSQRGTTALPAGIWRGDELSHRASETCPSGWPALDAELPGGGWPRQSATEVLAAQPAVLEWRLLGPALAPIAQAGRQIVVVGPPRIPHLPGLQGIGLDEHQFIWVQAEAPAERLWATEQLIKSNTAGAVVAWLPKARADQIRRLQVCALGCEGLVFLCRPETARHESSAAPLRVLASAAPDWELQLQILKRRGPTHDRALAIASVPGGLASVLTPRALRPTLLTLRDHADALGRSVVPLRPRPVPAVH